MKKSDKFYAVFGLFRSVNVSGTDVSLPKGQYLIPVFDNYDQAVEYAGGKFEVIELSKLEAKDDNKG